MVIMIVMLLTNYDGYVDKQLMIILNNYDGNVNNQL